jgi:hypothetical protein
MSEGMRLSCFGGEVLNEHDGHGALSGKSPDELPEGLEPAGGCSDSHHGEIGKRVFLDLDWILDCDRSLFGRLGIGGHAVATHRLLFETSGDAFSSPWYARVDGWRIAYTTPATKKENLEWF